MVRVAAPLSSSLSFELEPELPVSIALSTTREADAISDWSGLLFTLSQILGATRPASVGGEVSFVHHVGDHSEERTSRIIECAVRAAADEAARQARAEALGVVAEAGEVGDAAVDVAGGGLEAAQGAAGELVDEAGEGVVARAAAASRRGRGGGGLLEVGGDERGEVVGNLRGEAGGQLDVGRDGVGDIVEVDAVGEIGEVDLGGGEAGKGRNGKGEDGAHGDGLGSIIEVKLEVGCIGGGRRSNGIVESK